MTKAEIKAALVELGVDYPPDARKGELQELLTSAAIDSAKPYQAPVLVPPEACWVADGASPALGGHGPKSLCSWSTTRPAHTPPGGGRWVLRTGAKIPAWCRLLKGA